MYFVDRNKLEQTCSYILSCLEAFKAESNWDKPISQLGLERIVHVVIESIIDIGNSLIDGFIMRDPGSYEDIIDILVDEKVVPKDHEEGLKTLIRLRKKLVTDYIELNHDELIQILKEQYTLLSEFPDLVLDYVERELGPVSAFLPKE